MQIYSIRSEDGLSQQTAEIILKLVANAEGPIVLPLDMESLHQCREKARKPEVVKAIREHPFPLDFLIVATLAYAENKSVVPLYNSDFRKIEKKYVLVRHASEELFQKTQDRKQSHTFRKQGTARIEAEQLVALYNRWKLTRPALVIAEDNFAHVLGRLFRVKVHRLTRDHAATKHLVRRTMKEIPGVLGFKPQSRRPKKR